MEPCGINGDSPDQTLAYETVAPAQPLRVHRRVELVGVSAADAAELKAADFALMDRLTWGVTPSAAAHFKSLGTDRWIEEQLHPPQIVALPPSIQAQIEAMPDINKLPFDIANAFDQQGRSANQIADPDQKKAAQQVYQQAMNDRARQAAARSILRALYSPDQLRERMTWFWFNHFNVHQYKANIRMLVGDYEDRAIRPYAMGTFPRPVAATLHHPAMLRYLDNADNAAGHINENYAREIMELHTMGVGSGYTQSDVEELARILTGVGIDTKPEDPKLKPELRANWFARVRSNSILRATITATRLFSAISSRGAGWRRSTRHSTSWSRILRPLRILSRKLATYFV